MKKVSSVIIFIIFACISFFLIQFFANSLGLKTIYEANNNYEEETSVLGVWQSLTSLFIGYIAVLFINYGKNSLRKQIEYNKGNLLGWIVFLYGTIYAFIDAFIIKFIGKEIIALDSFAKNIFWLVILVIIGFAGKYHYDLALKRITPRIRFFLIDGRIPVYEPKPGIMLSFSPTTMDFGEISPGEVLGDPRSPEVSFIEFRERLFALGGSLPEDVLKGSI